MAKQYEVDKHGYLEKPETKERFDNIYGATIWDENTGFSRDILEAALFYLATAAYLIPDVCIDTLILLRNQEITPKELVKLVSSTLKARRIQGTLKKR